MTPTPAEYKRAKTLLTQCDALEAEIARLTQLVADAKTIQASHSAARWERLNVRTYPDKLAGLIDLQRRTDPETARQIPIAYHALLESLHPATAANKIPRTIDYAALAPDARPYLLGPFLGMSFGNAYPRLCLARSNPARCRLVYVSPNGPSNETLWRSHQSAISEWLGGDWELTAHSVSTVILERRMPLPASLTFEHRVLAPGQLFLGVDVATRRHVYMPFADMASGTFIPGATGTGKSNALHVLLQSIFANLNLFSAVYLVDGKDGVAMNRYRNIAPHKVKVLWEERDLWTLTTDLVAGMRLRNAEQRDRNQDNATTDFIAVVIDEMSTYTAKPSVDPKDPDNKRHARFLDELAMLARRGRSTGLRLFITAQEPVAEQIPATVRANCLTTIAFKLPIDAHAIAVFGELQSLPADPRRLPRGRALIKNGLTGELCQVQLPMRRM